MSGVAASKWRLWLSVAFAVSAFCATFLLLASVGYQFYLSASDGFRPYLNHVSSFADIFLCIKVGAVSFLLLNAVVYKNRKIGKVGNSGLLVFVLTVAIFFLMRKLNLICTYEDFVAHGV